MEDLLASGRPAVSSLRPATRRRSCSMSFSRWSTRMRMVAFGAERAGLPGIEPDFRDAATAASIARHASSRWARRSFPGGGARRHRAASLQFGEMRMANGKDVAALGPPAASVTIRVATSSAVRLWSEASGAPAAIPVPVRPGATGAAAGARRCLFLPKTIAPRRCWHRKR
jgi:hypothetical protein